MHVLTEGPQGKGLSLSKAKEVAAVNVRISKDNSKSISFDNYIGHGDNFKKRDSPLINIADGKEFLWSGTFEELIEKLK